MNFVGFFFPSCFIDFGRFLAMFVGFLLYCGFFGTSSSSYAYIVIVVVTEIIVLYFLLYIIALM